jgi:hypothetical protein
MFQKKIEKSVGHLAANTPRDNHQTLTFALVLTQMPAKMT